MSRSSLPAAAAAILGCAAFAAPAPAAVTGVDKAITVTANTSDILLADFANNAAVSLVRDNVTIAKGVNKNDPAAAPPEGGVNSVHAGALGGCWTTFTPQLLPGDVIKVGTDSTVVQGVTAEPLVISGDRIVVHGTAVTGKGVRLPADEIDAMLMPPSGKFASGSSGGQFLSAQNGDQGGIITYDAPGSSSWTARWPLPADPGDNARAREASVVGAWTGPAAAPANAGGEETDFEVGAEPGPIASCDTSPYRPNAPTGASRTTVNAATAGADLVITGAAQPGVTNVTVKLTDAAGKAVSRAVTAAGNAWSASFPGAEVSGLADGALSVSGTYKIAAGTFHGATMSLAKDTVAPAAPTASLPAGTYAGAQSVTLGAEPGATVRYTTDGSARRRPAPRRPARSPSRPARRSRPSPSTPPATRAPPRRSTTPSRRWPATRAARPRRQDFASRRCGSTAGCGCAPCAAAASASCSPRRRGRRSCACACCAGAGSWPGSCAACPPAG